MKQISGLRADELTYRCCVCRKVREDGDKWTDKEVDDGSYVSHGYCPDCFMDSMRSIDLGNSA
ncbi:MAG TPA: hypothetical protein VMW24_26970 [Sedimentisphaerales bacterium]|nr:hypothetical protein [Sedimentisphaerales bacterium]